MGNSMVNSYLNRCGDIIAEFERDSFGYNLAHEFDDLKIESPIEQLLYAALHLVAKLNYIDMMDTIKVGEVEITGGLFVNPQAQIGKYRVDFLVSFTKPCLLKQALEDPSQSRTVVVECDSQQFHERTEQERRYEKARDRHLLKAGYNSLHFTGKEIIEDPSRIASEVLAHVTTFPASYFLDAVSDHVAAYGL